MLQNVSIVVDVDESYAVLFITQIKNLRTKMDGHQLREKCVAAAIESLIEKIATQPDVKFDTDRGSNSIKSENTYNNCNLSVISRPESPSEPGRTGSSSFRVEFPSPWKFLIVPKADIENDFTKRSPWKGEDFDGSDNYQSRYFDDLFREKQSHDIEIPHTDNIARDHPLYQKATTGADGLYHCPWEIEASCNHKPEKLKCNYNKFVDSHLKPYRCKVADCENAQFSSTACLLRHEREAHAMHGHGEKPFLCSIDGCERAVPGHGFPRHWNLCDHMKRVHNRYPTPPSQNVSPTNASKKRKYSSERKNSAKINSNKSSLVTKSGSVEKAGVPGRALSLSEQYQHASQQLLSELMKIPDEGDVEHMRRQILKAESCLKLMARTAQEMNSTSRNLQIRERIAHDFSIGNESTNLRAKKGVEAQKKH